MSNPLVEAIRKVVNETPEVQRLKERMPTIWGEVTAYNDKTHTYSIKYNNSFTGRPDSLEDVSLSCPGGFHQSIRVGDIVCIGFPYGDLTYPVVISAIPDPDGRDRIAGSMTTNASKGL